MRKASPLVRAVVAALAVATLAFFLTGPDRVWTLAAGPADAGPVDIATLGRLPRPMDSLACTPPLCRGRPDFALPAYRRYVARTAIMRFPDTVDARAVPLGGGSGLMLYGRAQLGVDDYGVNRHRLETWAAQLRP